MAIKTHLDALAKKKMESLLPKQAVPIPRSGKPETPVAARFRRVGGGGGGAAAVRKRQLERPLSQIICQLDSALLLNNSPSFSVQQPKSEERLSVIGNSADEETTEMLGDGGAFGGCFAGNAEDEVTVEAEYAPPAPPLRQALIGFYLVNMSSDHALIIPRCKGCVFVFDSAFATQSPEIDCVPMLIHKVFAQKTTSGRKLCLRAKRECLKYASLSPLFMGVGGTATIENMLIHLRPLIESASNAFLYTLQALSLNS